MGDLLFYLSFIFEIGSIISIVFLVVSFYIAQKIKQLFPGGNIVKKWLFMQGIIIVILFLQIIKWVLVFVENEYLHYIIDGLINSLIGVFVVLIVYLSYNTYKIILGKSE